MEMDLRTPKKPQRKNPPFDPERFYQLYSHGRKTNGKRFVEYTEQEIVAAYVKSYGQPPEYIRCDGGGWTLGYIPDAALEKRRAR